MIIDLNMAHYDTESHCLTFTNDSLSKLDVENWNNDTLLDMFARDIEEYKYEHFGVEPTLKPVENDKKVGLVYKEEKNKEEFIKVEDVTNFRIFEKNDENDLKYEYTGPEASVTIDKGITSAINGSSIPTLKNNVNVPMMPQHIFNQTQTEVINDYNAEKVCF